MLRRRLAYAVGFTIGAWQGLTTKPPIERPLLSTTAPPPAARPTTPNPACDVCDGTGTDPVFHGDCTECWPDQARTSVQRYLARHREEQWEARRQQAALNRTP